MPAGDKQIIERMLWQLTVPGRIALAAAAFERIIRQDKPVDDKQFQAHRRQAAPGWPATSRSLSACCGSSLCRGASLLPQPPPLSGSFARTSRSATSSSRPIGDKQLQAGWRQADH